MNKAITYSNPDLYNHYLSEIMTELPKYRYDCDYHYNPTTEGVKAILDEYFANKGWLYPVFENHPQYKGNGQIVFSSDYHRKVNKIGVQQFCEWCCDTLLDIYKEKAPRLMGMTYNELCLYYRKLDTICDSMLYLSSIEIGQSKIDCRVNNMTVSDMLKEKRKVYLLKLELCTQVKEVCTENNSGHIANEDVNRINILFNIFNYISDNVMSVATEDFAEAINYYGRMAGYDKIKAVKGQKVSRIINKVCRMLGIDKNPDYGKRIAQLGDDINEMLIRRHTVISINPWDYLSMSFGDSWSNCSTIDKLNDRHINGGEHTYHGDSGSGTLSYMLDPSTVIYYMVDESYSGNEYELQPKTHRCLFYLGEDKMIQGRVYPKTNDGDNTIYEEIRTIMQKVVSEMFKVNNLWTMKQGASACGSVTETYGTHYPDYTRYDCCTVCWHNNGIQVYKNNKPMIIGHNPICIQCGREHTENDYIQCRRCR
jgi:hypothetical protein